ncbi:DUF2840 domain-containing protein [Robiginitomaculum antarcticum]|uniref:DUF2840 domain-containing protein n=1 Tax=Robiginitomaculum antarcticum TaxID=437507 RepID=UPI0003744BAE|nr:DUF2840 domain-containing protein [Robiginitomaculum antarcticum]
MSDACTIVTEHFVRGVCNHRLRFGGGQTIIERPSGIKIHSFRPFATFGMVRWTRNDHGTILWNLYICETQKTGRLTEMPGVYPGAELLLRSRGTKATRRLLARLTKLEKRVGSDLAVVPASYWRQYHHTEICRDDPPQISQYLAQNNA